MPPATTAAVATPGQVTPLEEMTNDLKKLLMEPRSKLIAAGGAAFLVVLVVGIGVGRILRGAPPQAAPIAGHSDGLERAEFEQRT